MEKTTVEEKTFDCWAVVEIFGHQQLAGRVTEQSIAGQGFIRVDVPDLPDMPGFTRYFGPGAIYSMIPTTEKIARAYAAKNVAAPIQVWQLQQPQLPARQTTDREEESNYTVDDDDALDRAHDPDDEPPF